MIMRLEEAACAITSSRSRKRVTQMFLASEQSEQRRRDWVETSIFRVERFFDDKSPLTQAMTIAGIDA